MNSRMRTSFLFFVILLGFAAVIGRAVYFQVWPDERIKGHLKSKHKWSQRKQKEGLFKSRGQIVDRSGKNMALSIVVRSFFADPKQIKNISSTARKLSPILKISRSKLQKRLSGNKRFVWLKREVSDRAAKKIEALNLPGIYFKKESRRVYPHGKLAKNVIGFSGRDALGLEGVEKSYDRYLQSSDEMGQPGVPDALGRLLLFEDYEKQWFEGHRVELTIDLRLQKIVEEELRRTLREKKPLSAQAIMMNPRTGAILAMASIDGKREDDNQLRNRSVSDVYEPGSVFKIILVAAAMEHLDLTANSQIYGEKGALRVGRNTIREYHNKKYEWISLQELMEVSSNVAAAKLGLRIGADLFNSTIEKFGFSKRTGIDLPGEASGLLRRASKWKPIELANISFGQGLAVTPVQLITAVSTVANGGFKVRPHIVSRVVRPAVNRGEKKEPERLVYEHELEKEEIYQASFVKQITDMLVHVTDPESTGANAAIKGYHVAGKTGTSQKLVEKTNSKGRVYKTYSNDKSIVSFMGFVPAYDPAFVLLVLYDEPEGKATGGRVAAPSFKKIASKSLAVMGISPQREMLTDKKPTVVRRGKYVGRSFQDILREIRSLPEEQRAMIDLIGFGTAVKVENTVKKRIKIFFE